MLARRKSTVNGNRIVGYLRALRWLPAALWMAGLFYLSHQSSAPEPVGSSLSPLLGHTALYAILAIFLYLAITPKNAMTGGWVTAMIVFSLAVLYGVSDEVHQSFVSGRVASEGDLLADAVGAALGVSAVEFVAHYILRVTPKRFP